MRLLILTEDPSAETNLRDPLEEVAAGEDLEVKVVAERAAARERFGLPVTELSAG